MRELAVYFNDMKAGVLREVSRNSYLFSYEPEYLANSNTLPIAIAFPKTQEEFQSTRLFPFFANMLPEGNNKNLICKTYGVDEDDIFGLLEATANFDRIGAVNVRRFV